MPQLKRLRKLTLQGNPVADQNGSSARHMKPGVLGYRNSIVVLLPWLKQLDFAGVTKEDRAGAGVVDRSPSPRRRRSPSRTVSGAEPEPDSTDNAQSLAFSAGGRRRKKVRAPLARPPLSALADL